MSNRGNPKTRSIKILAIGATGFIGSYVVRNLSEKGHQVALLSRGKNKASNRDTGIHINGDGYRLSKSIKEIRTFGPEVVIDFILYTEEQATELVEICRGLAKKIVVISSADVYRNYDGLRGASSVLPDPVPLGEDAPLRDNLYPYRGANTDFEYAHNYEKILVERALLNEKSADATILRLPAVFGPGEKQHRVSEYLKQMEADASRICISESKAAWRWTRGYVENVANAIFLAATNERGAGRIYNVGDHPTLTEKQWIEAIGRAAGWEGEVVADPSLEQDACYEYQLETDTSRIRDELGYVEKIALDESLRRTIDYERSPN